MRRATLNLSSIKSALQDIPVRTKQIALFATLFAVSVLITLAVLRSGRNHPGGRRQSVDQQNSAASVERIIEDFSAGLGEIGEGSGGDPGDVPSVQELILPQVAQGDGDQPHLLRSKLKRWGEEQINRYWVPLEEIALDLVRRENDRRIEKLFEDIP
jgi:hypothetical protein